MSQIASYHIIFETSTHFGEADVEVGYKFDDEIRGYYPDGPYQFFDIMLTDKQTGESDLVDEMPDDLLNIAKEEAEDKFTV